MNPDSPIETRAQNSMLRFVRLALVAGLTVFVTNGCGSPDTEAPSLEEPRNSSRPTVAERQQSAQRAAWTWLDQLEVDPVALIGRGVKGKKKLGEALSAYLVLLRHTVDPTQRKLISDRVRELAQHTARPEYHNMLECDIREFNQNSMSYLRVAWVLEHLEWDTTHYRTQLEAIRPRLEGSLAHRLPTARDQFKRYYEYFGWTLPAVLQNPNAEPSLVAKRTPLTQYRRASAYALAHEVSVAHRFGMSRASNAFDREDRAYLRRVLPALIIRFSSSRQANPDLVAELLSSMAYLDLRNVPAYQSGIQFLVRSQNPDGSWGAYEAQRSSLAGDTDTKLYLHTTMVALRALLQSNDLARTQPSASTR
jgi:hypothetical protein